MAVLSHISMDAVIEKLRPGCPLCGGQEVAVWRMPPSLNEYLTHRYAFHCNSPHCPRPQVIISMDLAEVAALDSKQQFTQLVSDKYLAASQATAPKAEPGWAQKRKEDASW